MKKLKKWLFVIAFNLILFALILAAAEFMARRAFDNKFLTEGNQYVFFEFDKMLGWRGKPDSSGSFNREGEFKTFVKINSQGLRDMEYSIEKPADSFRVAVLGDSFTWGFGVENEEIYTEVLERELGDGFEVINFGISGFGRGQQLLLLESEVLEYEPDAVVVLAYPGNDLYDNIADDPQYEIYPRPAFSLDEKGQLQIKGQPIKNPSGDFSERLFMRHTGKWMRYYSRSYLFRIAYHLVNDVKKSWQHDPSGYLADIYLAEKMPLLEEQKRVESAILAKMKTLLDKRGIPMLYVVATTPEMVRRDLQHDLRNKFPDLEVNWYQTEALLMQAAVENGIESLILRSQMQASHDKGEAVHNEKDFHWTVLGNEIAGKAIKPWVMRVLAQKTKEREAAAAATTP